MKLSLNELESYVANLVTKNKISNGTFSATRNNIVGLLDKIGKITTLDHQFIDRLEELDGQFLKYGKIVESYHEDLIMPSAFDRAGTGALTYESSSYRPVFYSYPIARQKIKMSIPNDDIEQAVNDGEEFASIIAMKHKRLVDSEMMLKYQLKRELLGKFGQLAIDEMTDDTHEFTVSTKYVVNTILCDDDSAPTIHAIVVKEIASDSGLTDLDDAIEDGYAIPLNLVEEIDVPVDTETGEKFIERVKAIVEIAKDVNEGNSLNGNTLGVSESLKLYTKFGINPSIQVQTMAGAFNKDDLSMGVEVKAIKDFGGLDDDYFAMLVDTRGVKLHPNYKAVRENLNGDGDFLNIFSHLGFTPFVSRNTLIHLFKAKASE